MNATRLAQLLLLLIPSTAVLTAQPTLYVPGGNSNIGNSNNSNVGIGVTNPSDKLHIKVAENREIKIAAAGSAVLTDQAIGGAGISFSRASDGADGISAIFQYQNSAGTNRLALATRDDLVLAVGGSSTYHYAPERLRIEGATGNVGIGTTNPTGKLQVAGGSDYVGTIRAEGPAGGYSSFGLFENGTYKASMYWHPGVSGVGFYGASNWFFEIGNVGIGVANPSAKLQVKVGENREIKMIATSSAALSDQAIGGAGISFSRAGDGADGISAIFQYQNSAGSNRLALATRDDLVLAVGGSSTYHYAPERFRIEGATGNVGIGTATPSHKLAVNGAIRAKEVIVDTGWADYVFAKDYRLAPLSEVERHIEEHQHLPGIPSAAEVAEHGVSLGEMQARMMAKIEELTLHVIAQEKRMQAQEAGLLQQQQQIEAQRIRILSLQAELNQTSKQ